MNDQHDRISLLRWKSTLFVFVLMMTSSAMTMGLVYLSRRLSLFPTAVLATLWTPLIPLAVSSLLGTVLTGFLIKYLLKPLEKLIEATRRAAKGDLTVRVDPGASMPEELEELFTSFNAMTEELGSIQIFKEDFINTFSHEFKTPIVSIRGFAKQLKKETLTPEQRSEYIDIILSESERLSAMSSNVLLLSRLENQQMIPDAESFRMDDQIRDCIVLLKKSWEKKDIQWNLDLEEQTFCSNPKMIEHIWLNLLGNAIKFSPGGGEIAVKLWREESTLNISVQDHGPGMDGNVAAHVFDKFYQGDRSHAAEGNGLGLAIVRRVVELCGGTVHLTTAPDQGSVFLVALPAEGSGTA